MLAKIRQPEGRGAAVNVVVVSVSNCTNGRRERFYEKC